MGVSDPVARNMLSALKENVEIMSGVRSGELKTLSNNASLADVISKVNEIIARLNVND